MSEWVRLMPSDILYADILALKRQASSDRSGGRVPMRGAPRGYAKELQLNIIGCRCECAGFLYCCNVCPRICCPEWHAFVDNPVGLPDFDDWVDVKGRSEHWHEMPVQSSDPPDRAYTLVRAHAHPLYEIVGWCYGWEAHQLKRSDPTGRDAPAHWVNPKIHTFFKQPALLFAEMARRHEAMHR